VRTISTAIDCSPRLTHHDPGQAFVQNLRSGRYAITADLPEQDRVRVAFDELALVF